MSISYVLDQFVVFAGSLRKWGGWEWMGKATRFSPLVRGVSRVELTCIGRVQCVDCNITDHLLSPRIRWRNWKRSISRKYLTEVCTCRCSYTKKSYCKEAGGSHIFHRWFCLKKKINFCHDLPAWKKGAKIHIHGRSVQNYTHPHQYKNVLMEKTQ